jgi:tRNA modification GTPase
VLQTIEASSSLGLEIARSGLDGRLQQAFSEIRERLVETAAELEAILDYPGEDLIFSSDQELIQRLNQGVKQAQALAGSYQSGRIALQGARISLVGPVNAGKSSLFNALLGKARALVSPQPGTTRDVVESPLQLDQVRILLCDTAGIRETVDPIEAEGVELARSSSMEADLRLLVVPLTRLRELQDTLSWMQSLPKPAILVGTHADQERPADFEGLMVSSKTGAGIMELKKAILHQLNLENTMETQLLLGSQRQRDLLLRISEHTQAAILGLQEAGPAVAAERLYEAIGTADELDGKNTREDVLDRLFQRFCVGK